MKSLVCIECSAAARPIMTDPPGPAVLWTLETPIPPAGVGLRPMEDRTALVLEGLLLAGYRSPPCQCRRFSGKTDRLAGKSDCALIRCLPNSGRVAGICNAGSRVCAQNTVCFLLISRNVSPRDRRATLPSSFSEGQLTLWEHSLSSLAVPTEKRSLADESVAVFGLRFVLQRLGIPGLCR